MVGVAHVLLLRLYSGGDGIECGEAGAAGVEGRRWRAAARRYVTRASAMKALLGERYERVVAREARVVRSAVSVATAEVTGMRYA